MKTKYFLCFILFFISSNCFSQKEWASIGTIWHYNINNIGETGYLKIESQKDTLVEGKVCKLLQSTKTTYAMPGIYQKQYIESLITYQDNDKIYIYQHNAFLLLYDFNPSIGDIWDVWGIWNEYNTRNTSYQQSDTTACPAGRVRVDSVKNISLNNKQLKAIYTSPYHNSSMQYSGVIIEQIGCLDYLLPISKCNFHIDSEYPGPIRCYNSSDFSYSWFNKDCEYTTGIGNVRIGELTNVFPNPSNGLFNIKIKKQEIVYPIHILVTSIMGQEVFSILIDSPIYQLQLGVLDKGVYLLSINDKNSIISHSKITIK
ncbi:MAG: T9SS type A sorting domain-containing protein [Paludibacter sp.]